MNRFSLWLIDKHVKPSRTEMIFGRLFPAAQVAVNEQPAIDDVPPVQFATKSACHCRLQVNQLQSDRLSGTKPRSLVSDWAHPPPTTPLSHPQGNRPLPGTLPHIFQTAPLVRLPHSTCSARSMTSSVPVRIGRIYGLIRTQFQTLAGGAAGGGARKFSIAALPRPSVTLVGQSASLFPH